MFSENKRKRNVCFGFFYFLLVAFVRRIRFVVSQEFEFCLFISSHHFNFFVDFFYLVNLEKYEICFVLKLASVWHTH